MIGKLKGTIEEIGEDHVLIDVHGVCYVAFCSSRTLSRLGLSARRRCCSSRPMCAKTS
jgi:Holliday junction resolvasome RuvABC DNA-binding subunit